MPLQPIKSMQEYKRIKEELRNRFDSERSGDQMFQREQTKAFEPLINIQKETSKATQDKIVSSQEARNNELVPLVQEMQRRNDQIDMLVSQPFYQAQIEQPDPIAESTPVKKSAWRIDVDRHFDESDIQNLKDMSLELPSKIFDVYNPQASQYAYNEVIAKVKTEKNSLKILKSDKNKKSEREGLTDMYKSRYDTVNKYERRLNEVAASMKLIASDVPQKVGQGLKNKKNKKNKSGVDLIICSSTEELCHELQRYCAAKEAGNTGVDNHINAILDKLLKDKQIDMKEYNDLYKKIFKN